MNSKATSRYHNNNATQPSNYLALSGVATPGLNRSSNCCLSRYNCCFPKIYKLYLYRPRYNLFLKPSHTTLIIRRLKKTLSGREKSYPNDSVVNSTVWTIPHAILSFHSTVSISSWRKQIAIFWNTGNDTDSELSIRNILRIRCRLFGEIWCASRLLVLTITYESREFLCDSSETFISNRRTL